MLSDLRLPAACAFGFSCAVACAHEPSSSAESSSSTTTDADTGDTTSSTTTAGTSSESGAEAEESSSSSTGADVCAEEQPAVDEAVERWAQVICGGAAECQCRHVDVATCFVDIRDGVSTWWDEAIAAGLAYDAACMASRIAYYGGFGCEPDTESLCAVPDCKPFYGDVAQDGACAAVRPYYADDCSQGLVCTDAGLCKSPRQLYPTVGLDEPCFDDVTFALLALCDDGLACDYFGTNRCFDAPAVGEPCELGICEGTAWCDGEDDDGPLCKAPRVAGEACVDHWECESIECVLGVCAPRESSLCMYAE